MKVICKAPRRGKTYRLIHLASQEGLVIVCDSKARVENVLTLAKKMRRKIKQPITIDEVLNGSTKGLIPYSARNRTRYAIDDADDIFERILDGKVEWITYTDKSEEK